jgi:hypothetical protein
MSNMIGSGARVVVVVLLVLLVLVLLVLVLLVLDVVVEGMVVVVVGKVVSVAGSLPLQAASTKAAESTARGRNRFDISARAYLVPGEPIDTENGWSRRVGGELTSIHIYV